MQDCRVLSQSGVSTSILRLFEFLGHIPNPSKCWRFGIGGRVGRIPNALVFEVEL